LLNEMTEYFNEQTPFLTHSAKYPVSSINYLETSGILNTH